MNHVGALEITTVRDFLTTAMNSFYILSGQEASDQATGGACLRSACTCASLPACLPCMAVRASLLHPTVHVSL